MQTRLQSRPDEPNLILQAPNCTTPLWGVWEMWCVVPDPVSGMQTNASVRGSAIKGSASPKSKGKTNTMWLDQVRSIGLFDNAEGFWGIVSCTLPPSQMPPGITYYMLRRNIAPMWEHEANRRGGRWVIRFQEPEQQQQHHQQQQQQQQQRKATSLFGSAKEEEKKEGDGPSSPTPRVDEAWETLCIALIGEQLPCDETEICGAALRRAERRREWKLSLWTRNASDRDTQERIGQFVKSLLHLENGAMQYLSHRELMQASEEGCWRTPSKYEL
ncbi:eukaryotic translation initiation factor 4E (eIF4E) interacting protein [Trypanosoma theileri]|uniref:Eukaryotic translation initiation factor 4E (eIF4E) interacting protein n=1 Tax=Trypanosoma theileri TaxID=67003 RepID=A0A1X0P6Z9_9TRYP|nr:eukaryotic translation initiation factor 4E (eIF4E) interacting protein [Trypanosoma theileri]ORC92359.1 eukaryotic translation initiation factor 4E (eIF4E) interacting protein [Trypanosoma theileri]